jgi:hypothetical protein
MNIKYKNILTKKFLIQEYVKNKKSAHQIAEDLGIDFHCVCEWIHKQKIRMRKRGLAVKLSGIMRGENNPMYIDGRTAGKHYCKNCHKLLKNKYAKYCIKHKALDKNRKVRHHKNLNRKDDSEDNIIILKFGLHRKLHQRAYDYLVELGLIDNYLKWFDKKYGLK